MKRTFAKLAVVGAVAGGLAVGMPAGAAQAAGGPTDQDILKDAETPGDVLTYGMGTQGQRYSPLKPINPDTVKKLVPAWAFSFGGEKQRGQESQPLIHDGMMYVTGSYSRIFALDATHRQEAVEVRAPPARRHHALLRRGQPRRRAVRRHGLSSARSTPSSWRSTRTPARWSGRRRSTTITAGYSMHRRAADRQRHAASPAFRRRVRRRRPRRGARRRDRRAGLDRARRSKATWARSTRQGRERHHRHDQRDAGRATCGRPAARPPGWAAPTTPRPKLALSSAPATRRPGTATCARATTSTRRSTRRPSTRTPARSSGTTRPRRTTAGTSTASTSSSPSTEKDGKASRPAPRPTATASST